VKVASLHEYKLLDGLSTMLHLEYLERLSTGKGGGNYFGRE